VSVPGARVLITGAGGQLGRELVETVPAGMEVSAHDSAALDVTQPAAVVAVLERERPAVVINTAAFTAVDRAEAEPDRARAVNTLGAAHVADAARRVGARVLHLSTDYVFDGSLCRPYAPDDAPNPVSVYGQTKLEGEREVMRISDGQALIIRTAWLYGVHGPNFVDTMLGLMRQGPVRVVADQLGTPTWTRSLAESLWSAVARPAIKGTYHWTDAGVASWYDFAVAIQEEALGLGLLTRAEDIRPIRTDEYVSRARRPQYAILDTRATRGALDRSPVHWRVNLRRMLADHPRH
jgi:dTDP-4-dehydrorhamnose reductase